MIKANEVRLGNWFIAPPSFISRERHYIQISIIKSGEVYNLEPIPLTPEILEKVGFARRWEGSWQKNSVEIEQSEEQKILGGFILLNGEERSHWPNVYFHLHQLQNLYSALTGAELEINLDK